MDLDEVKLRESLKKGEIDGVILWKNNKTESDDFKVIYKASDVNAAAGSGNSKHGNDFFYVNKNLAESTPLKAAGILRDGIQGFDLGRWWNFVMGFCCFFLLEAETGRI